jgi:hypothetical protein
LPKKSKEKPQLQRRALLAINEQGGEAQGNFEESSQIEAERNLLKISAPLPLIKTFGIRPLFAGSVSIDSTFKQRENEGLVFLFCSYRRGYFNKKLSRKWYKKYSKMVCFFM